MTRSRQRTTFWVAKAIAVLAACAAIVGCAATATPTGPVELPDATLQAAPTLEAIPSATTQSARPTTTPVLQRPTPEPFVDQRFAGCSGTGTVQFAQSPMRVEDVKHLLPYGTLAGAHVTPIDHMYFEPADRSLGRDVYEVRAIQDGVIHSLQPRDISVDTGEPNEREWRMEIAHTCTFVSYFDLITSLDPALEDEWNETQGGRTGRWSGIPVKAGQLVGLIGGQTLDFGVYDYEVVLPGFVVPEHYERESWKIHTVDPFPYFPQDVRDTLLAITLRQAEPRAGKIDHDVDSKLVGNWFEQGTNGYAGAHPQQYWNGHLALVPDALDPTQWRFSIGDFDGQAQQFGIRGNAPEPSDISVETGLVTYELADYEYYVADDPSRHGLMNAVPGDTVISTTGDRVRGVALVQMTGPRTVMVEVFPDKTAADVSGFTAAAKTYER